ncbi:MAG: choice-of-anchor B family protein, partial [Gammaproteobacteria bacterium]|nr:choice-of-anchor B family protein [Gammaproteobacteria bacterium]
MTISGGMACPVPDDADSAYHTLSRLRQLAPKLGVERASPVVQRDSGQAHACEGGVAEGFACNNVDLMSFTPLTQLGGGTANDIWGWTDALTGKEYALLGKTGGTAFVDISDPVEPLYLGTLPTHTQASTWRDIKVHADHAFIVSEAADHGMQVFDLTQLRGLTTPQNFVATTHYDGFGAAHNIAINTDSGFAYAVGTRNFDDGCAGGLHMVDISTPTQPQFAGCYSGDGYTHDAQCVIYTGPDSEHQGKEICFNYNEDTLTIVDVTNKATPVQLARVTYFGSGYTHQGWVTEDQAYLLLDDEKDELAYGHNTRTYIWDIGDLDAPVVSGSYLSSVPAIDHNQYIRGSFAFQANYRAGLRILDISNIASGSLVENGYFDTYPGSDGADFDGSWSVYPYFPSGHVIVSGIDEGLFVLEPTALEPGFMLNTNDARLEQCGDGISSTFFTVDPVGSYNGAVSFAAAGAPPGVTIGFTPASVTPPANFIVAANVAGAQPGLYPVTITATDGELGFDQTIYLELSQQLPATPQLLLPATNAKSVSAVQTLYWNATPGAFHYDLDIATDPAFTDVVLSVAGLQQNSYAPVVPLPGATGLYWRVRAFNACGSQLSATRSFTTAPGGCE